MLRIGLCDDSADFRRLFSKTLKELCARIFPAELEYEICGGFGSAEPEGWETPKRNLHNITGRSAVTCCRVVAVPAPTTDVTCMGRVLLFIELDGFNPFELFLLSVF